MRILHTLDGETPLITGAYYNTFGVGVSYTNRYILIALLVLMRDSFMNPSDKLMTDNNPNIPESSHPIFSAYNTLPRSVKTIPNSIMDYIDIQKYLLLLFNSPLRTRGWFESYNGIPQEANNGPLPWYSYAAIDFIEERLSNDIRVFEYGSGSSTYWYANLIEEVVAVEHDTKWAERVREFTPSNATIIHRDNKLDYLEGPFEFGDFDIVVIDGQFRSDCAAYAVEALSEEGVIIWDDTHNDEFSSGYQELQNKGFKEIFFQGMGPVTATLQRTSVFYRRGNCLDI